MISYEMNASVEETNVIFIIRFFNLSCLSMIPKFKTVFRVKYCKIKWYFVENCLCVSFAFVDILPCTFVSIGTRVQYTFLHVNENGMNEWISTAGLIDDIRELAEQMHFTDGHIMFSCIFIL